MFSSAIETGWLDMRQSCLFSFFKKKKSQTGGEHRFWKPLSTLHLQAEKSSLNESQPRGGTEGWLQTLNLFLSLLGHRHHGSSSWQRPSVHFWNQTGNWKPLKLCRHFRFYLNPSAETFKDLPISNHSRHASISVNSPNENVTCT